MIRHGSSFTLAAPTWDGPLARLAPRMIGSAICPEQTRSSTISGRSALSERRYLSRMRAAQATASAARRATAQHKSP